MREEGGNFFNADPIQGIAYRISVAVIAVVEGIGIAEADGEDLLLILDEGEGIAAFIVAFGADAVLTLQSLDEGGDFPDGLGGQVGGVAVMAVCQADGVDRRKIGFGEVDIWKLHMGHIAGDLGSAGAEVVVRPPSSAFSRALKNSRNSFCLAADNV